MRKLIFFLPIQLLLANLKRNHLLLILWLILFGFVSKGLASKYGIHHLFLAPEYLNHVSFWSYAIVGLAIGGFVMTFNISSYIINSRRFPFIAALKKPFVKFCINNSLLPFIFLVYYILQIIHYQIEYEKSSSSDIAIYISALLIGYSISIILSLTYFSSTNRNIFKIFLKKNDVVLVQSLQMKIKILKLINHKSRVEVMQVTSNSFMWPDFRRDARRRLKASQNKIRMVYPAAGYQHKNHLFVDHISHNENLEIIFTTAPGEITFASPHVTCIGKVSRAEIFEIYKDTDALLFLSSCESLGLPLLEAIKCNIPILCPNRDYSFNFPSENCIFFDINDPISIQISINKLRLRLASGWWPNWNFDKVFEKTDALTIGDILLDR